MNWLFLIQRERRTLVFFLQPSGAFEGRKLLLHDSKVLIFGTDGGGYVFFISELHEGKVGWVWDVLDDVFLDGFYEF